MSTPHLNAPPHSVASCVLLPGDPCRAEYLARTLFDNPLSLNTVRNMSGFTGTYQGYRVSILGSGMGMPSCCLYAEELVKAYGVTHLIRLGTCGSISDTLSLGRTVLASHAHTESVINRPRWGSDAAISTVASWPLLHAVCGSPLDLQESPVRPFVGGLWSTDHFYAPDGSVPDARWATWRQAGAVAVDMETAGLYGLAQARGVQALTVAAVSDDLVQGKHWSPQEREQGVTGMTRWLLERLILAGVLSRPS